MILAQNRRLLLSGSSLVCLLFLIILLDSCTRDVAPPQPYDDRAEISRDTVSRAGKDVLTIEEIADLIDSTTLQLKNSYNIALLLPLYLDSIYVYDKDSFAKRREKVYPRSQMGLSFYKGAMMALDNLERLGLKAKITVLDTRNSTPIVKHIIESGVLAQQDLIIGPVYNNNLRLVANYMKKQRQYVVSPLSPANDITAENPYYIMVNPTLHIHINKLFDYALNNFAGRHFVIYHQPTVFENEYAKVFKDMFQAYIDSTADTTLTYSSLLDLPLEENQALPSPEEELEMLRPYFDTAKANVVIVPSVDKSFILNVSRRLSSLTEERDITVMGLPAWGDFNTLRLDYINRLNVHFTSTYWVPPTFYDETDTNSPNGMYMNKHNTEPGEFELKGYDMMMYFGTLLMQFGLNYDEYMTESMWEGTHTSFNFKPYWITDPNYTDESVIDLIENNYVHLLRYENHSIVKLR